MPGEKNRKGEKTLWKHRHKWQENIKTDTKIRGS
jgi:hypothetical protein